MKGIVLGKISRESSFLREDSFNFPVEMQELEQLLHNPRIVLVFIIFT